MTFGRPFLKGTSGNPQGRPKRRLFDDTLKGVLSVNGGRKAKELTGKLVETALKGDVAALRLIAERVGGKPLSALEVTQQQAATDPPTTREQTRAKLLELLRSPELRQLIEASLRPPEVVQ